MQEQIKDYFGDLYKDASKLILYRELLKDSIIAKAIHLFYKISKDESNDNKIQALYYELCADLFKVPSVRMQGFSIWEGCLLKLIASQENPFTLESEKASIIEPVLFQAAVHDGEILIKLLNVKWEHINKDSKVFFNEIINSAGCENNTSYLTKLRDAMYCANTAEDRAKAMSELYFSYGSGKLAQNNAFKWDNEDGLVEVACPNNVHFHNLIGYDTQKATLINNTEAFLSGKAANNILLFGDRGTGKSSSVKALINKYKDTKLRIIEVTKQQLIHFNVILNTIRNRNYRFIIFIDDLSFEDFETEYKYLKAIIEGGIEAKPQNTIIYATSNRRHLIKETWADRDKQFGEIHSGDAMQEKLSLVDRFGITITYTSPEQEEYLKIVQGLAAQQGIVMDINELNEKALHWALWHNGRSGRTAQQFITSILP